MLYHCNKVKNNVNHEQFAIGKTQVTRENFSSL